MEYKLGEEDIFKAGHISLDHIKEEEGINHSFINQVSKCFKEK